MARKQTVTKEAPATKGNAGVRYRHPGAAAARAEGGIRTAPTTPPTRMGKSASASVKRHAARQRRPRKCTAQEP